MNTTHCSCEAFEKLEGASVAAYTAAFLDDLGRADASGKNLYRCRACGREWEKRPPAIDDEGKREGRRPALVRLN